MTILGFFMLVTFYDLVLGKFDVGIRAAQGQRVTPYLQSEVFHNYYPVTASTAGLAGSLSVTAPSGTAVGATSSIPPPSLTGPTTLHPAGSSSSTTIHPIHPSTFSTPRTATATPSTPILPSAPAAAIAPTLRQPIPPFMPQIPNMPFPKRQGDKDEKKPPETDEENEEPEEVDEEDSVDKNDSTYVPTDEDEEEVHYHDNPSVKKPNSAVSKRTRHQHHKRTLVKRHKTQKSPDTSATTSPVLSHSSPDFDVITQQDKVNDQLAWSALRDSGRASTSRSVIIFIAIEIANGSGAPTGRTTVRSGLCSSSSSSSSSSLSGSSPGPNMERSSRYWTTAYSVKQKPFDPSTTDSIIPQT
eukprot:g3237.t1